MMGIYELKTNSYWNTRYTSSAVNNINSTNSQQNQLGYAFQSLQKFPSFSWQAYQEQQDQYRNSISNFTSGVRELSGSVKSFMSNASSDQRSVTTNGGTAVTGEAKAGAKIAQYNVSVNQVAASQQNESKTLSAGAYGGVAAGISTFGIQVGSDLERHVSVKVVSTDTNSQVLKKFTSAINNSGAGVNAEVKTKNNEQYLSIISKNTGAVNRFTLRDLTGSGIGDLQLTNKTVSAQDANYSINGINYQKATNKVALDKGNVSLNINAATTDGIKVNVGKDDSKVVSTTQKLVSSYNRLHDILSSSGNNITKLGTTALHGVESLVGKTWSADFSSIGISLDKNTGYLQVDSKKLSAALESDSAKVNNLLTGTVSLGKVVERASKAIENTPVSNYIKVPNPLNTLNYGSTYSTSGWMFAQNNLAQGLFLNMMV